MLTPRIEVNPVCQLYQDCPTRDIQDQVSTLKSTLHGSKTKYLHNFPSVVEGVLVSLTETVKLSSEELGRCSDVVSTQAKKLIKYLDAADDVVTGPAGRVHTLSQAFFTTLNEVLGVADRALASVAILRSGKAITDALTAATANFTPKHYDAYAQEVGRAARARASPAACRRCGGGGPPPHTPSRPSMAPI